MLATQGAVRVGVEPTNLLGLTVFGTAPVASRVASPERKVWDSNPPRRVACTPLPTVPLDQPVTFHESGWRDLNPRPCGPEPHALTKLRHNPLVGTAGFEPAAPGPPDRCADLAAPHPDAYP